MKTSRWKSCKGGRLTGYLKKNVPSIQFALDVFWTFLYLRDTMMIQEKSFQRGALDAFVPPFVLPVPPRPKKWSSKESDIQDDADSLRNDWCALGFYVSEAVSEHERNSIEAH